MKSKYQKTVLAAATLGVAAVISSPVQADAMAQSLLNINSFTIRKADSAEGGDTKFNPATDFSILNINNTGDVSASLAPTTLTDSGGPINADIDLTKTVGDYVDPYTPIEKPNLVTKTGVTSEASIKGDALTDSSTAKVGNIVSLKSEGNGTAQSNTGLTSEFTFVLEDDAKIQFAFEAERFLRAYLGQDDVNAQASVDWLLEINDGDTNVFSWSPDGVKGSGIVGGTEFLDDFRLNGTVGANSLVDNQRPYTTGKFEAETNLLAEGVLYTLNITHKGVADAEFVPEPETLSLLGLAFLGLAFTRRRGSQAAV
jgi:hypothetical protein